MEITAEKTKLMNNNANGISVDIRINGEKLDEVDSFKYLAAVVTDQGSIACENIPFSSLFVAGDVSRETFPAAKSEEKRMYSEVKGSRPEVLSRIAQTTALAALARLKTIWNDKHISLSFKARLIFNALPGYLGTVVRLRNLDIDRRHPEEIAGHGDEML